MDLYTNLMNFINASDLSPEETYKMLSGLVVPRPIAWITTISTQVESKEIINLAPFSCFTFVSNKPPMIGINIGTKAGISKDTSRNIHEHKEFVVNIADETMIAMIHESAVEHPPECSEVELLGLTTIASIKIKTPRLAIVPASMECRFHSATAFGNTGSEFIVGEVLAFHIRDGLNQNYKIDSSLLRPIARLAGPNYAGLGEIIEQKNIYQTPKVSIK